MCFTYSKKTRTNLNEDKNWKSDSSGCTGSLKIIGIGPGSSEHLTLRAKEAIEKSDVIVGYNTYIKLLGNLTYGKEIISSGMTREIERANLSIQKAFEGKHVSIISSGDSGIYGMAGLVLELLSKKESKIKPEIIPGVPALCSCASLLGAPLMHDFAVISLSDILTDKKLIEKRVRLASSGDFVIVFYNPKSKTRREPFDNALKILLKYKSPDTPVGIVRNAYRNEEKIIITTLKKMIQIDKIDMSTTIIVGNSKTYIKGKFMITPRGYDRKLVM